MRKKEDLALSVIRSLEAVVEACHDCLSLGPDCDSEEVAVRAGRMAVNALNALAPDYYDAFVPLSSNPIEIEACPCYNCDFLRSLRHYDIDRGYLEDWDAVLSDTFRWEDSPLVHACESPVDVQSEPRDCYAPRLLESDCPKLETGIPWESGELRGYRKAGVSLGPRLRAAHTDDGELSLLEPD